MTPVAMRPLPGPMLQAEQGSRPTSRRRLRNQHRDAADGPEHADSRRS